MNDEKNLNEELEEVTETAEEAVEETTEAVVEEAEAAAEEAEAVVEEAEAALEEAVEEAEAAVEEAETVVEEAVEETEEAAAIIDEAVDKKQLPTAKIAVGAVVVLVVAAIVVLAIMFLPKLFNKYNRAGYVDVSGRTIAEVAESAGMDLADFLESYGLPADMPANTSESAAYYTIPCSLVGLLYGMYFETLKSTLELPDSVTEDTTWGEAEGEARLSVYVGDEERLKDFKEQYGLGDEITGDTQWKEIRNIVDEHARQARIESEKAAKEAEKEAAKAGADDTADIETGADTADAEPAEAPAAE